MNADSDYLNWYDHSRLIEAMGGGSMAKRAAAAIHRGAPEVLGRPFRVIPEDGAMPITMADVAALTDDQLAQIPNFGAGCRAVFRKAFPA